METDPYVIACTYLQGWFLLDIFSLGASGFDALPIIEAMNGVRCPCGDARTTVAGALPVEYVIHAVGPNYRMYTQKEGAGGAPPKDEYMADGLLHSAYVAAMREAAAKGMTTVAFSLLSSPFLLRFSTSVASSLPLFFSAASGFTSKIDAEQPQIGRILMTFLQNVANICQHLPKAYLPAPSHASSRYLELALGPANCSAVGSTGGFIGHSWHFEMSLFASRTRPHGRNCVWLNSPALTSVPF